MFSTALPDSANWVLGFDLESTYNPAFTNEVFLSPAFEKVGLPTEVGWASVGNCETVQPHGAPACWRSRSGLPVGLERCPFGFRRRPDGVCPSVCLVSQTRQLITSPGVGTTLLKRPWPCWRTLCSDPKTPGDTYRRGRNDAWPRSLQPCHDQGFRCCKPRRGRGT